VGDIGPQGAVLIGPTGRTGATGATGMQGVSGQIGEQGASMAGVAGVAGPSGLQGVQGGPGLPGAQGVVGIIDHWTAYRQFTFYPEGTAMTPSDMSKASDVAAYLAQNPSIEVGIDGSINASGYGNLSNRRADAVRIALIQAGVPANRILIGAFADPNRRQNDQAQILIKTQV
jgi:hypothetical protein